MLGSTEDGTMAQMYTNEWHDHLHRLYSPSVDMEAFSTMGRAARLTCFHRPDV